MEKLKIFYFSIPTPTGNFGDDAIYYSVKSTFSGIFKDYNISWIEYPLRNHTTSKVIDKANECDFVLIGGGGLLMKSRIPNLYSEWQWAISIKHLERLKNPLVVYSIGYNVFRGQESFTQNFVDHLNVVLDKSIFFSVRNTGSKKSLIKLGLSGDKILVNPCPTLFIPPLRINNQKNRVPKIGFNLAGDRAEFRFNNGFYKELYRVINQIKKLRYSIYFFNYNWNPTSNCDEFLKFIGEYNTYDFSTMWGYSDVKNAIRGQNEMDIMVSMRSHSQMIPFGQRKKVVSLISHDKLRWFLEDAHMESTGVDVNSFNFYDNLVYRISNILNDDRYDKKQDQALKAFKEIFDKNNNLIKERLHA